MEALCGGTSSEFLNLVDVLSITSRVSEVVNIMAIQWVDLDRGNFKTQEAKSATRGMLEFEQATVIGLLNDTIFAADLALKNTVDPDNLKKITRARDAVQATSVLLNNVNFLAGESFYRN
jgi:hypothetical protein